MRFVLLDETGGATPASGETLTPAILAQIAERCTIQLNRDFSAEYGGNYEVRAGAGAGDLQPGEIAFAILPQLPSAPGAIAYHDSDGNGVPVLLDAITLSDSLMGAGNSLSVAISHELLETARDEGCNDWLDDGQGSSNAAEVCDPVESGSYAIDGIAVSNFVLKSFWVPGRKGPYDYMSSAGLGGIGPAAPFATAPGGYQIVRTMGTGEQQVQARYASVGTPVVTLSVSVPFAHTRAARRLDRRRHAQSRASRRGVRE